MKRLVTILTVGVLLVAASAAFASGGLSGRFKAKLTGTGTGTDNGALDGVWTATLKSGKITLAWDGVTASGGTYKVSGSTIVVTPNKGGICKGPGKYSYKVSGNKVTFKRIVDGCGTREVVLARVWTAY